MRGANGRSYLTDGKLIKISRVFPGGGRAHGTCPTNGTYGEIDLVTTLFEQLF